MGTGNMDAWLQEKTISESSIREELVRVLSSPLFRNATRASRFLTHVVEQTLQGRAEELKEYVLGLTVFDRSETFDPRIEPVVRVEAGRVRQKLTRYYQSQTVHGPVRIELPKGAYVPLFRKPSVADAPEPESGDRPVTVAITRFTDNSDRTDQGYICEGIVDELTRGLTRIEGLQVFSAAARTWAQLILEGSIRRDADRLRIGIRLIERKTGRYLWSERYDRQFSDVLSLQEEIVRAIVGILVPRLTDRAPCLAARATNNPTAYRVYLKGRHFAGLRTGEGLHESISLYQRALEIDPGFALAHAGLADSFTLLANYGVSPPGSVRERAYRAAQCAVRLAPDVAEVHVSLAHVVATYLHDWDRAESEYEHAIDLNPRLAAAHHWYAITCLMPQRRLAEAQLEMEAALELDPVSVSITRDAGVAAWARRDFESAADRARHALKIEPGFHENYWILALACEQLGQLPAAIDALERAASLRRSPRIIGALGHVLGLSGRENEARARLYELQELSEERYVSPFEHAVVCLGLRDFEQSLEWLEAARAGQCYETVWLRIDPRFDPLRQSSRFQTILNSLGL